MGCESALATECLPCPAVNRIEPTHTDTQTDRHGQTQTQTERARERERERQRQRGGRAVTAVITLLFCTGAA